MTEIPRGVRAGLRFCKTAARDSSEEILSQKKKNENRARGIWRLEIGIFLVRTESAQKFLEFHVANPDVLFCQDLCLFWGLATLQRVVTKLPGTR